MRGGLTLIAVLSSVAVLLACDKKSPPPAANQNPASRASLDTSCSSPTAVQLIQKLVTEDIESEARDANKGLPEDRRLDLSKVRAFAGELQFELQDIITTKNDPNSTKKFCEAQLTMRVPSAALDAANRKRKELGRPQVQTAAEDANFKVDLNKFVMKAAFNVQPTDDGQKLYLGLENATTLTRLAGEIVLLAAIGSRTAEPAQTSIQEAARPPASVSKAEPLAPAVAGTPATGATSDELASSSASFAAAERDINTLWKALPKPVRDTHLDAQRAFNVEKESVCFKEASAAGDGAAFEIAKNKCWTRFYLRRIPELKALGQ